MPSYYRMAAQALPDPGTSGTWERRLAKGLQRLGWLDGRRILSLGTAAPLLKDIDESLIPRDPDLTGATLSQRLVGGSKRDLWLACLAAVDYVATHPHEFSFGDYPSDTPLEEVPGWSQDPGNEPEPGDLVVVNGLIALGRLIEDAIAYLVAPGNTSNRQAKAIMQNIADQLGYIAPLIIDADNWVGTTYDPATGKIKANKSVNGVISALGEVVQNVSLGDEIGGITWAGNYYITYNDVAIAGPFDIDNVFDDARRSGLIAEGTAAIWISAFESAPQSSEPVVVPPETGWTLTVAAGKTTADLANFPIYVNLADMPPEFWNDVDADGGNIRVTRNGAPVPFDIVLIDGAADTGVMFVLADSLLTASDNDFNINLSGNGLLDPGDPNGREAVWAAFDLVYMGESSTTHIDRTGGADGSETNTVTSAAPSSKGPAGCGVSSSDAGRISFTGRAAQSIITIGGTFQLNVSIAASMAGMGYYGSLTTYVGARQFNTPDYWNGWNATDLWVSSEVGQVAAASGVPRRVMLRHNGTTQRQIIVDGALEATDNAVASIGANTSYQILAAASGSAMNGRAAYCYARAEYLSDAYLAAEYSNLNAPTSFYTIT